MTTRNYDVSHALAHELETMISLVSELCSIGRTFSFERIEEIQKRKHEARKVLESYRGDTR